MLFFLDCLSGALAWKSVDFPPVSNIPSVISRLLGPLRRVRLLPPLPIMLRVVCCQAPRVFSARSSAKPSDTDRHKKLASIFSTPDDILFKGGFQDARQVTSRKSCRHFFLEAHTGNAWRWQLFATGFCRAPCPSRESSKNWQP